ncbi:hypothetical protein KCTC52924_01510 [Arenibacter antarcticus]|uniref:GbsR/MarR family transcriptional regulator n=1 Tax=Arenibacter antarcticus TaxID=2040469 RepID=A0ABW5VHS5_9FLAO|nr:MarR family transcriptional regulator [Arenibacter sp. H213]MCM4166663.1 transcriptional regulator [Arenibacter sp. H213]
MGSDLQRNQLIEELGVYFENNKILSPLAARIFSMMILTDQEGISFDEFVEGLDASKSSISTNLQLLQASGRIVYFTKPGERKRYFKVSPNDILDQLEKKIEQWETEKKMHLKVYEFKKNMLKNSEVHHEDMPGLHYTKTYAKFVGDFIQNLKQLQENLKNTANLNSL